jgi:Flp pilus assembly protein TadG
MVGQQQRATTRLQALFADCRGVAALEFALFVPFLVVGLLNVSDTGVYLYKRMEVESAAQVGAMSALKACNINQLPATTHCPELNAAVTAAVQSTSLGTGVIVSSLSEGYYCLNSSDALQYVASASSPSPVDCSAVGSPMLAPADYLSVTASYNYAPLFDAITVAGLFKTPITKTAMMRMQ